MKNIAYIATSLDGYVADNQGGLDWLHNVENPNQDDMGFAEHMASVDALVMGKNTLDTVLSFDVDWPYNKPVFVLSNRLKVVPDELIGKLFIVSGDILQVIESLHKKGFENLYIDGGKVIQQFISAQLLDEIVITTIPTLLGGGAALFGELEKPQRFELIESKVQINALVQSRFRRLTHE